MGMLYELLMFQKDLIKIEILIFQKYLKNRNIRLFGC